VAPGWRPDLLDGFERLDLPLTAEPLPGESEVVATLVRRTLEADPRRDLRCRAVLSLPGWNDYFFHAHTAEFFEAHGFTFYALDPRRSGRSLRDPAYRDFVTDLAEPFEELDAARELIASTHSSLTLSGHSTGGLTASLWASKRPGKLDALVLNSPWLTLWGAPGYGRALLPAMDVLSRRDPLTELKVPDSSGRYTRWIHTSGHGEWDFDLDLKAPGGVPIRTGWLRAVLLGQRQVARGLAIEAPIFVGCSARSFLTASRYSERARTSDIVLDTDNLAASASRLGRLVTLVRVDHGFHDLTLSVPDARARYFAELERWLGAYVPEPGP